MEDDLAKTLEQVRIKPRGETNHRVISVLLREKMDPTEYEPFHCINCGKLLFHYYSEVAIVIEGEVRDVVTRPIDIMCRGSQRRRNKSNTSCKTVYRIM